MVYIDGLKNYILTLKTIKYVCGPINVVEYELITNHPLQKCHPFEYINVNKISSFKEENKYMIHGINADNIVTDALFTLIMSNDDELYLKSGITEVQCYRAKLIKQLCDLCEMTMRLHKLPVKTTA